MTQARWVVAVVICFFVSLISFRTHIHEWLTGPDGEGAFQAKVVFLILVILFMLFMGVLALTD